MGESVIPGGVVSGRMPTLYWMIPFCLFVFNGTGSGEMDVAGEL